MFRAISRIWGAFASISNLVGLRKAGAYVDKTEQLSSLLRQDEAQYIFLRPRRWGKSALIDSLAQYFYGHKAVFEVHSCALFFGFISPNQSCRFLNLSLPSFPAASYC